MIEIRPNPDLTLPPRRSGVAQTRITLQSPLRQRKILHSPSPSFQDNKKAPIFDQSPVDGRQMPMTQPIDTHEQIREALAIKHLNKLPHLAQPSIFASRQIWTQENPYSLQVILPDLRQANNDRQDETEPRDEPDIITLNTEMHTEANLNTEPRVDTENAVGQDLEAAEDNISKTASYRILYHFIFNSYLLISYVLGYLLISSQISTTVPFITSIVLIVFYIFLLIKTNGFSTKQDKISLSLSIGNSICFIIFIIAAFIRTKTDGFLLTPFCVPGVLVLFGYCTNNQLNDVKTPKLLLITLKFVVWLQVLLISLPIDGAPIEWNPIFVPSYFLFMMLGFFSLILIIGAVVGFISLVTEEGFSLSALSGSLWYILNALYVGVWFAVLSQVVKRLDSGEGDLKTALLAGVIHSGIMFVYSLIFWRPLCKFQELEITSLLTPIEPENESKTPQVTFKVSKETKLKLIMISPTFFQYLKSYPKTKSKNNKKAGSKKIDLETQGDLESQRQKKDNERLCAVCFDRASNAVLMNCGHGGVCYECALEHWKKTDNCMMCRMTIIKVLKIADTTSSSNEIQVVESVKKIVKNGTL